MKPTGIIRRVDDLGRVVIPKDIRRKCGIKENEPLEIYMGKIDNSPCVCFARYSVKIGDELEQMKEEIANEMEYCGEPEMSAQFREAMAEAMIIFREFKKRD